MGSLGRGLGLALAAMCVAAVGGAGSDSAVLGVNGRANANASVAAHQSFVAVAWSATDEGGATDIYASVSRDAGRTFDRAIRVNDVPGDARVSGEQPPRVSLLPKRNGGGDADVVVIWPTKRPDG